MTARQPPGARSEQSRRAEAEARKRLVRRVGRNKPSSLDDHDLYKESNREGGRFEWRWAHGETAAIVLAALVIIAAIVASSGGELR